DEANTLDLADSPDTNPDFIFVDISSSPLELGKWYMAVGIIHGESYSGGQSGLSGVWDPETGERIIAGTDFKKAGGTTQIHLTYMYYGGNENTRVHWAAPCFEVVDGTEPSLASLFPALPLLDWRREIIHDDFAYVSADDLQRKWAKRDGGIADADITLLSGLTDAPGGQAVRFGNNSGNDMWWGAFNGYLMPFDPNSLYEVGVVVRRNAGSGVFFCGLEGVAADRVTLINIAGSDSSSLQHYLAASNVEPGSSWTTYVGYVKGHSGSP